MAEKIHDQAVAVLDDPRLRSAIPDAEERVKHPGAVPSPEAAAADEPPPAPIGQPPHSAANPPTVAFPPPPASITINPATGLPASGPAGASRINPATGLPILAENSNAMSASDREFFSKVANADVSMYGWPAHKVDGMIINGQYDEALQTLRQYLHRERKDKGGFDSLLNRWLQLCRKFPKARKALIEVRDQDVQEFYQGRGTPGLFWEVYNINWCLQQGDATIRPDKAACALFKIIQERNKPLAAQCYPDAERWLVPEGEYELCRNYLGDPQARFDFLRNKFEQQTASLPRMREIMREITREQERRHEEQLKEIQQRREESERQVLEERYQRELRDRAELGLPPPRRPTPSTNFTAHPLKIFDPSPGMTNDFVIGACNIIEILAGTGNKSEAEKIRDQAAAVLNDPRLKSAIGDAEEKIRKRSIPAATSTAK